MKTTTPSARNQKKWDRRISSIGVLKDDKWTVVPLCKQQLLDIQPEDVLGDFRLCDVYRAGGGYDKFPQIYMNRFKKSINPKQFVVQLRGCHLCCPYCYVTKDGVWGEPREYTTAQLVDAYRSSGVDVFHLMGGSPALYLQHWGSIIQSIDGIFHSDLLCTEQEYQTDWLQRINRPKCLYAVNVKGVTSSDHLRNTGRPIYWRLFWRNLERVCTLNVPFYLTFTNPDMNHYAEFRVKLVKRFGEQVLNDSFIINIVNYNALMK
jgi:pyruvate-formate lyase-activating enzyme